MSVSNVNTCRLCRSTQLLEDLFKCKHDTMLDIKINYCIGLNVHQGDGLPSTICKACVENIEKFYNFKKKCLQLDLMFKTIEFDTREPKYSNIANVETVEQCYSDTHYDELMETSTINNSHDIENKSNLDTLSNIQMDIATQKQETNKFKKLYQCEFCGRLFKVKTVLDQHLMIHSGIKPFPCQICHKTYARAENRKIHMRSHMGIKPYICEVCGSSSTKRQDLIRHMKIHSDERRYSCTRCNRHFKRSSDVASHMRTHTGLRPYSCRTCAKTYTSRNGLRKHCKRNCTEIGKTQFNVK